MKISRYSKFYQYVRDSNHHRTYRYYDAKEFISDLIETLLIDIFSHGIILFCLTCCVIWVYIITSYGIPLADHITVLGLGSFSFGTIGAIIIVSYILALIHNIFVSTFKKLIPKLNIEFIPK